MINVSQRIELQRFSATDRSGTVIALGASATVASALRGRDVIPTSAMVLAMFKASQIDLWEKSVPLFVAIILYAICAAAVMVG